MKPPLHPDARAELDQAIDWTAGHWSPAKAVELNDALAAGLDAIGTSPFSYPEAEDAPAGYDMRNLILNRFPYRIVSALLSGGAYVFAIAHTSRRPGYWQKRIDAD